MKLWQLKMHALHRPVDLRLFSTEGDIYVLQINGWDWLTDATGKKPKIFHSLSEARESLGKRLTYQMHLEPSEVYDEMISSQVRH